MFAFPDHTTDREESSTARVLPVFRDSFSVCSDAYPDRKTQDDDANDHEARDVNWVETCWGGGRIGTCE